MTFKVAICAAALLLAGESPSFASDHLDTRTVIADPRADIGHLFAWTPDRYRALATLLADDRLWVNSESTICMQFFAVELAALEHQGLMAIDCGGRTPTEDAVDVYRSLLVTGATTGVDDGVDRDEREHSITKFPFLAAP